MSDFELYFSLGLDHIADINAYDHILFLVALCAVYKLKDWKNVLVLVTAFTIGHSITLALSTLNIIVFSPNIIEKLIPITIMLTALLNIVWSRRGASNQFSTEILDDNSFQEAKEIETTDNGKLSQLVKYGIALSFGFIHGMGFSNYLKELLMGMDSGIVLPLFSFNLGVEAGQICIVLIILAISYIAMNIIKIKQRYWNWIVSCGTFLIALYLLFGLL